jgi:hypothetical protein
MLVSIARHDRPAQRPRTCIAGAVRRRKASEGRIAPTVRRTQCMTSPFTNADPIRQEPGNVRIMIPPTRRRPLFAVAETDAWVPRSRSRPSSSVRLRTRHVDLDSVADSPPDCYPSPGQKILLLLRWREEIPAFESCRSRFTCSWCDLSSVINVDTAKEWPMLLTAYSIHSLVQGGEASSSPKGCKDRVQGQPARRLPSPPATKGRAARTGCKDRQRAGYPIPRDEVSQPVDMMIFQDTLK